MRAGSAFPRFSFSVLEVDAELAVLRVLELHDAFHRMAERVGGGSQGVRSWAP
jgi:hypothetical protein